MAKTKKASEARLLQTLGIDNTGRGGRWAIVVVVVVVVAGALAFWQLRAGNKKPPSYRTVEAGLGDMKLTVTATGTLQGVDTVDVGTEVSGKVIEVLVDFNERVKRGQVLARIDPEQLEARLEEAGAQLLAAQASVRNAQASEKEANLKLERTTRLVERGLLARQELDTATAAADRAAAARASSMAQETVATASLRAARTNAGRANVVAPIDGVVLSRAVEPGQTVAASFQAPVLFTLARDLTALTLRVDVDEADVGKVKEAQSASFAVSAWPDREFESTVVSVRNVPKTTQGSGSATVVTYEAVLSVDNADGLLRPGMTATATIVTEHRENVVTVPTAALRFTPPEDIATRTQPGVRMPGLRPMGGARGATRPGAATKPAVETRTLWTLAEGEQSKPVAVQVRVGPADTRRTEILSGLTLGTTVIIDQIFDDAGSSK